MAISWFPEGDNVAVGDMPIRSLQKINDLLYNSTGGGGTTPGLGGLDNLAALYAVTAYSDKATVAVLGGAIRGDGNGGFYEYDATSLAVDDGFSVIQPSNNLGAGRWLKFI